VRQQRRRQIRADHRRAAGDKARSADIAYRFHDRRDGRFFTISNHITSDKNDIRVKADDGGEISPDWLTDFFSISLMSEAHFCSLDAKDQALTLGVDTSAFDARLAELKEAASDINRDLKRIGALREMEPCGEIDIDALLEKRRATMGELNKRFIDTVNANKRLHEEYEQARRSHEAANAEIAKGNEAGKAVVIECGEALALLKTRGYRGNEVQAFIDSLPPPRPLVKFTLDPPRPVPEVMDERPLEIIDEQIRRAGENNIRHNAYADYLRKKEIRDGLETDKEKNERQQEKIKNERLAYIKKFNFGFANLGVNDKGGLELDGRPIRKPFYSTGERIRIVSKLMAAQHPLFRTVFLDSACELDPDNLGRILSSLADDGYSVIVSVPSEKKIDGKRCIVLRECSVVNDAQEEKENLL
jgi:hypothetical protein